LRALSKTTGRLLVILLLAALVKAQDVTLSARVALVTENRTRPPKPENVVLWLTPIGTPARDSARPASNAQPLRLVQKDKSFRPHVLVVPVGAMVQFPNQDPFFHNVFSYFEGKSFDLGLYEAGSTRNVHFDKPGISYIFCNIHPQMSAVVVALDTPYYGISDSRGQLLIPRVPTGRYMVHIWYEEAVPDSLGDLTREVTVSQNTSTLGLFRLTAATLQAHKNKYGKDYEPPSPESPAYAH